MSMKNTTKVFILLFFIISVMPHGKPCAQEKDSVESEEDTTVVLGDMGILPTDETEEEDIPPIEKMPELVEFIRADYPEYIYKKGIEGSVLLNLVISDSGTVDSVAVERGVHPFLDSSALKAAAKFRFTPAIAGGEPVSVFLQYEYHFSLKEIVDRLKEYINFTGRLLEKGTRKPIRDALVVITFIDTLYDTTLAVPFSVYREYLGTIDGQYIEEDRLVTMTDSTGNFVFYSLPTGPFKISSPLSGYEEFLERDEIRPNEKLSVVYHIRRISYSDYEVVVYGRAEEKEVSRHQLTLNEIKRIPGLGGDAVKVVQALPGVARPT
ncbi:MAG: energy transducer TonB, partial [Chitinispirillia bacterium]